MEFSTDCLIPLDKTMAKDAGLIFFAIQHCFSPRDAFWGTAVHTMHFSWTYYVMDFMVHSSFLTTEIVDFVVGFNS